MSKPKRKTAVIRARVTESLKEGISREAKRRQLCESTIITMALLAHLEKEGVDTSALPDLKTR